MAEVVFRQGERRVIWRGQAGATVLEAAQEAGVMVDTPCGGGGTCGKCRVHAALPADAAGAREEKVILACRTAVSDGLEVRVESRGDVRELQIVTDGHARGTALQPAVRKEYDAAAGSTAVYLSDELAGREAGDTSGLAFGLAVDIGTTTLVVALYDLQSGRELASAAALNPQSRQAQDVLSRIRIAAKPDGLAAMFAMLSAEIDRLAGEAAVQAGVDRRYIYEAVYSGNTCMLHLATATDPSSLGKYPYRSQIQGDCYLPADKAGLTASPWARIYLPPIISGFVGADITAGILASGLQHLPGVSLFVDVGTNGEVVLAGAGTLRAASTAAGPAFEGMNITFGMRAAPGAIERVTLAANGTPEIKTIGGRPATGLCGSGLIDLTGQLVMQGWIGQNGRFTGQTGSPAAMQLYKERPAFRAAAGVYLTQKDIRQVQLAKGAVRAGIEALLAESGIAVQKVDRVLIAGSFGYHLDPDNLVAIGLLPAECRGKIEFLGNTALTGARMLLLDRDSRLAAGAAVAGAEALELALLPGFDKLFVKCLEFPRWLETAADDAKRFGT